MQEISWNRINKMQASQAIIINKIEALEQKIQTLSIRLHSLESSFKQFFSGSESMSQNPLERYLFDKSEIDSIPSSHTKVMPESKKNHSRHHSQQVGNITPPVKKHESQQKALDVKSFRMIKRSILLNSDEIDHVKAKLIELEKTVIEKVMNIEEGVAILARLTQTISEKINKNGEGVDDSEGFICNRREKRHVLQDQVKIDRVIKKYQKPSLLDQSRFKMQSQFYL